MATISTGLLEIFSDASVSPCPESGRPGFGGFGVCFWSPGSSHQHNTFAGWRGWCGSLGKRDNIYIAEVLAISKALLLFLDTHRREGARFVALFPRLAIISDSKNALDDIERYRRNEGDGRGWEIEIVVERILAVERLGVEVSLCWVRGHSSDPGNEYADWLAARGRELCEMNGGSCEGEEFHL